MNLSKSSRRDKKIYKRKNGMRVDGRSIFTIMKELIKRKDRKTQ